MVFKNACGVGKECTKVYYPQKCTKLVCKMWTECEQMCTSCTLPSMTSLDTPSGNWVHFPNSFQLAHRQYPNLCTTWTCTCTREFPSCALPAIMLWHADNWVSVCVLAWHCCVSPKMESDLIVIPCFAGFMMWSLGQCSHGNQQAYTIYLLASTLRHIFMLTIMCCNLCNYVILSRASCVIYLTIHRGCPCWSGH